MEAISHAGTAVGILAHDGIIIGAERKQVHSELEFMNEGATAQNKLYKIDDNMMVAVAGLTADANTLIKQCRMICQQFKVTFQSEMPVEALVQKLCNLKQRYTHSGGKYLSQPYTLYIYIYIYHSIFAI
jgi:20S proteasome subunit alpha 3